MRFELTSDQRDFMAALDKSVAANPEWASVAAMGVPSLLDDAGPVELVCAFEVLGRHAVAGPWIESAAFLATALTGDARQAVLDGAMATVGEERALDADTADQVYAIADGSLHRAEVGEQVSSVDPARRLLTVTPGDAVDAGDLDTAHDLATLAAAADLLGAGERVLRDSVEYVKQRTQFGRPIGSYQAIKHQLADVRIALDFARPLVHGAAVDPTPRSVSAAKIQASDAAHRAARVGLQVHGAIGYTAEYELSRWLLRIRALHSAWGTPTFHRGRLLEQLS